MSSKIRVKQIAVFGKMTVYRRPKAMGEKPYVVGMDRDNRLTFLEEFETSQSAKIWAKDNQMG
jgi:hypothetical protein